MTSVAAKKRQSHGLTLPQNPSNSRDSVVSNIISSLATLDETSQLHWISETSRQVDNERAYQRQESMSNGNGKEWYERSRMDDGLDTTMRRGYSSDRERSASFGLHTPAPTPSIAMGRPAKQGFFRRFMGMGPKVPIDPDILPPKREPKVLIKNQSAVHVPPFPRKPVDSRSVNSNENRKGKYNLSKRQFPKNPDP